jgi:eukaryotic-like serine/threonine-protein kinase
MSAKRVCSLCEAEYEADQKFCPNDGAPLRSAESRDDLVGQIVADRYRILSTLGEGGMGRVYLAEHIRMGRQCAVKVISPALASTDAAVARFNREAANASQINHPNVVQVYDFGEGPNHTLYLAMEYVEGETITSIIGREGPLPLRRAAMIARQVADALGAAHHRGIVHRDLKPDNILVTRQFDGNELVKVVDFGIAKTVQSDSASDAPGGQTVTTVGVSVGTPEYMSPEQLAGERLDTRTDIYSLGVVFFHMLTGDLPYPRVTSRENLIRRLMTPPRTLREVRPGPSWPDTVQPVLDRALASELDKRYATAADFGRDLAAIIAKIPDGPEITVARRSVGARPSAAAMVTERVPSLTEPERVPAAMAASRAPEPHRSRTPLVVGLGVLTAIAAVAAFVLMKPSTAPQVNPAPVTPDSATSPVTAAAAVPDTTPITPSAPASVRTDSNTRVAAAAPQRTQLRDSAPAAATPQPVTPPVNRYAALQRRLDDRIDAGRRHVIAGNVAPARAEFRQAALEVANVLRLQPNDTSAQRLRDSVVKSLRGVVQQCQGAQQRGVLRITEPGFRCPSLVPPRFLGPQRGR